MINMFKVLLAQEQYQPGQGYFLGGRFEGFGPLGETWRYVFRQGEAISLFNRVISIIIGVMTIAAGLWFIFQFMIGAFGWLTAGGDKAAVENAQKRITNAMIGLVIVVAAVFLIDLLGGLLGLEILNPGKFILGIWQK